MFQYLRAAVQNSALRSRVAALAGVASGLAITTGLYLADDDAILPMNFNWSSEGAFGAIDMSAARRGFEVYRQVCATCHSLENFIFRRLVGNTHTEEQAKKIAGIYKTIAGPNEQGEMFERPCGLEDGIPKPYANEETARVANNGAVPPDLSYMVLARPNGMNYVFSLLLSYSDRPAGVPDQPGTYFNHYFSGGQIAMAPPLTDGQVTYEDGTPGTVVQYAKDVVMFLLFVSSPDFDRRKRFGFTALTALCLYFLSTTYWKRFRWNIYKTRKIAWQFE